MYGRRLRRIGGTMVIVAGVAVIVLLATGQASLVTTHGVSMLPRFHTGDLAIIVPSSQYHVGEIVGYWSPLLHVTVLHRIVAEHGGLFTFKGDNNSFLDPVKLPASSIKGRLWMHIPHAGTVLGWIRSPMGLGLLAFCMVAFCAVGGATRRRRVRSRTVGPGPGISDVSAPAAPVSTGAGAVPSTGRAAVPASWWPVGVPLALAGIVGVFLAASWSQPITRPEMQQVEYKQQVRFSYSATAPPGVTYPTGSVTTGDPVFVNLVDTLDVSAHYVFGSTSRRASSGTRIELSGTIDDTALLQGPGGWSGPLATAAPVAFSGPTASVDLAVDLRQMATLEGAFSHETGIPLGTTDIVVTPTVHVRGSLDGAAVSDSFSPPLDFVLSDGELSLVSASSTPGPAGTSAPSYPELTADRSGSVGIPVRVPARMAILGRSVGVTAARRVGLGGLLLALAAAAVGGVWVARRRRLDEPARIRATYGHDLVTVCASPATHAPLVVDVETFSALARVAERYECVILEHAHGAGHAYYVESGATVYRYGLEPAPDLAVARAAETDSCRTTVAVPTAEPRRRRRRRRGADMAKVADEVDVLTRLAQAEWVSGIGDPSAHLRRAVALANEAGLDEAMIAALVVDVRSAFDEGQRSDPEKIALLHDALERCPLTSALRARVLGALAVELIFVGDATARASLLDEAHELVRRAGDPVAIVDVAACECRARPRSTWSARQFALDQTMIAEALDIAVALDDPQRTATMQTHAALCALIGGDGEQLRTHARSLARTSAGGKNQIARRAELLVEQMIATLDGRVADAEALSEEAVALRRATRIAEADRLRAIEQLALAREHDRLAEVLPVLCDHVATQPGVATAGEAAVAFVLAAAGYHDDAACRLHRAWDAGFGDMPDDVDRPFAVAMWSEVAAHVGDRDAAKALYEVLVPYDGIQLCTSGIACGPAARLLAKVELVLDRQAEADRHFVEAIELANRLQSPVWIARCKIEWAETWLARGHTTWAGQLIDEADAVMARLSLPALQRHSAHLRHHMRPHGQSDNTEESS